MSVLRGVNAGLSFALELALIAAVTVWGWSEHRGLGPRLVWGVLLPVVVVVVWAVFLAPRSEHRIGWPWLPVVSLVLFELGAVALWASGHRRLAVVMAVLALANVALVVLWRQH